MRYSKFAHENLDIKIDSGKWVQAICPFHNDTHPSFSFNVSSGGWVCHACGEKGNIFKLADKLKKPITDTGVSSSDLRKRMNGMKRSKTGELRVMPENALSKFPYHPAWRERGLTDATITKFQLGWDPMSHPQSLTIPIRDDQGQLSGVIYRKLDDSKPKYLYPFGFARARHLFGSWLVRKSSATKVALVEGPVDCIACWDVQIPALAMLGSSLSPDQSRLLKSLAIRNIVVMTDNDNAGREALLQVTEMLHGSGIKLRKGVYKSSAKDPAELTRSARREMFTGDS